VVTKRNQAPHCGNELAHHTVLSTARAASWTGAGKAKLYCPVQLVQTHYSLLGALVSLGLNNDDALSLIEDAKHKRRRHIIANPGNNECFVVVSDSRGVVQIWQAMTDHAKPRRSEAEAFIVDQRAQHNDTSQLAVFPLDTAAKAAQSR
jgi:hypothetical protein